MNNLDELKRKLAQGRLIVKQMQSEIIVTRANGEEPLEEKVAMLARYEHYLALLEQEATKQALEFG
jgi:hypothetical protein